jgi:hypothetical protein
MFETVKSTIKSSCLRAIGLVILTLPASPLLAETGVAPLGIGQWTDTAKGYLTKAIKDSGRASVQVNVLLTFGSSETLAATKNLQTSVGGGVVKPVVALVFPEKDFGIQVGGSFWSAFRPLRAGESYNATEKGYRDKFSYRASLVYAASRQGLTSVSMIPFLEDEGAPSNAYLTNLFAVVSGAAPNIPIIRSPINFGNKTPGDLRINNCRVEFHEGAGGLAAGLGAGDRYCTDGVDVLLTATDTSPIKSLTLDQYITKAKTAEGRGVIPLIWWLQCSKNTNNDPGNPWDRRNIVGIANDTEKNAIVKALKLP